MRHNNNLTFPDLPEGQRWNICWGYTGTPELELQARRKTFFGRYRWKTVARHFLVSHMYPQQALDYAVEKILAGYDEQRERERLHERWERQKKKLQENFPEGPVE